MKVLSLSVGRPQEVDWDGKTVLTSIFKTPVDRRLKVAGSEAVEEGRHRPDRGRSAVGEVRPATHVHGPQDPPE